jgi:ornithine decarboxylase
MQCFPIQNLLKESADNYCTPQTNTELISQMIQVDDDQPFFIVNLGDVIRQYYKWKKYLPNVTPFYAVKCNPDPVILELLANLGASFDCASQNEMDKILKLGVGSDRIIFAHPCKFISHIKFAKEHDVSMMTFDSENELYKIKEYYPDAKLLLRIKTDDKDSICPFSVKFGAAMDEVEHLLKLAKRLGLNIAGTSFHCGSGARDTSAYHKAIRDCKKVFDIANEIGFNCYLIDFGGGYSSVDNDVISFKDIADVINNSITEYFGNYSNLQMIAEPGRFMVGSSHILILKVINKKIKVDKNTGEKKMIYYVNNGVYSFFNNLVLDHFVVNENNIFPLKNYNKEKYNTRIEGCSCDSADLIADNIRLVELAINDHCYVKNMGAYTRLFCSTNADTDTFNGFSPSIPKYIMM